MTADHSNRTGVHPAAVALAVAIFGILAMLIVDHGPWNRPDVQTAEVANSSRTGESARSAGAAIEETEPRVVREPETPGPKPVQPAIPNPR